MNGSESGATPKIVFRLAPFIRPHGLWMSLNVLCSLCNVLLEMWGVYLMQDLTDKTVGGQVAEFQRALYAVPALIVAGMIVAYLKRYASARYTTYTIRDLRDHVAGHIQRLPVSYTDGHHTGDLVSRLNNDIGQIAGLLKDIPGYVYQPLVLVCAFVYLLLTSWKLLLVNCLLILVSAPLFVLIVKPMQAFSKKQMEAEAKANAGLQDAIGGIYVAKAFNLKNALARKHRATLIEMERQGLKINKQISISLAVYLAMRYVPLLVCPLYGGYLAFRGEISVGALLACNSLVWFIAAPVEALLGLVQQMFQTMPAVERVLQVLDQPTERADGHGLVIDPDAVPVAFENVSFGYSGEQNVLESLSFQLEKDKTTALVGASGSGKSTVFKLLCGFYEPHGGQIGLHGNSLLQSDLSTARAQMSLVSQDVYLFPTTIAENIAYGRGSPSGGRPGATREEVVAAAKAANAHEFIVALPKGYDTLVGERGVRLSGGERQRIALARAILKDAPILLLDEPTSALDTQSERLVEDALERFVVGRTVLVVAHRLSTIDQADEVLVLDEGRIVERGTHKALIERNGLYKKLYLRQMSPAAQGDERGNGKGAQHV
jgi:ABC-type multidrug transport system fused ATPase/permease subunit